jgi:hypothetical protein
MPAAREGGRYGWTMPRLLLTVALAALALAAAAPAASAATNCYAAGAPVCVRAFEQGPLSNAGSFKPKRINTILYTVPVVGIRWQSWTRTKAVGRGRLLRCGVCDPAAIPGPPVTITLTRPVQYFCGPSEEELEPIGVWFSRATIRSSVLKVSRNIIDRGHPNAC